MYKQSSIEINFGSNKTKSATLDYIKKNKKISNQTVILEWFVLTDYVVLHCYVFLVCCYLTYQAKENALVNVIIPL